MSMMTPVNV
jgi:hypothetical protein